MSLLSPGRAADRETHRSITTEHAVRVGIAIDLALEIAQQQVVPVPAYDRIGSHQDLASAAGRVDHEHRRGVTGGVAAQRIDDFQSRLDRGAEMTGAFDRI